MNAKRTIKKLFFKYSAITLGCIIYSLGVALFLDPDNLAAGGVTGVAIFINYLSGFDTGLLIIILNIPLFILGAIFFGRNFTLSTLFSTVLSSLLIELWTHTLGNILPVTESLLISSLIGGALYGTGLGLIFRMGSTTGGTDIIVKILRKKFRYIKTGIISLAIDMVIIGVSAFIYRDLELTFYTVISIVAFTLVFDWVLYGGNSAKLAYIITDGESARKICDAVLDELDVGATYVDGEGAYTGDNKRIILCAVKNTALPKLRDIVCECDKKAFMIISSANEVYGEGYKPHDGEEL